MLPADAFLISLFPNSGWERTVRETPFRAPRRSAHGSAKQEFRGGAFPNRVWERENERTREEGCGYGSPDTLLRQQPAQRLGAVAEARHRDAHAIQHRHVQVAQGRVARVGEVAAALDAAARSEEHTSELQSPMYL